MKIINKKHLQIEFLVSKSMVNYEEAINFMEQRVNCIAKGKKNEAVWFLEHPSVYTTGRSFESKTDNSHTVAYTYVFAQLFDTSKSHRHG